MMWLVNKLMLVEAREKELEDVSNIQVINGAKGCTRDIMVSCLLCLWSSELLYLVKNGYVLFCF